MRNRLILVGLVVFIGYWFGIRTNRPVVKNPKSESARRQAERLWKDPKARKSRKKARAKLAKALRKRRR